MWDSCVPFIQHYGKQGERAQLLAQNGLPRMHCKVLRKILDRLKVLKHLVIASLKWKLAHSVHINLFFSHKVFKPLAIVAPPPLKSCTESSILMQRKSKLPLWLQNFTFISVIIEKKLRFGMKGNTLTMNRFRCRRWFWKHCGVFCITGFVQPSCGIVKIYTWGNWKYE